MTLKEIGNLITRALNKTEHIKDDDTDRYNSYVDRNGVLWLEYPSGYYAMPRVISMDDIIDLCHTIGPNPKQEEFNTAVMEIFGI